MWQRFLDWLRGTYRMPLELQIALDTAQDMLGRHYKGPPIRERSVPATAIVRDQPVVSIPDGHGGHIAACGYIESFRPPRIVLVEGAHWRTRVWECGRCVLYYDGIRETKEQERLLNTAGVRKLK